MKIYKLKEAKILLEIILHSQKKTVTYSFFSVLYNVKLTFSVNGLFSSV